MNWQRIRVALRHHFLATDFAVASLVFVLVMFYIEAIVGGQEVQTLLKGNRTALYGGLAQVAGSLLGFIITSVSILIAFLQLPIFKRLRNLGHSRSLTRAYFHSIYWLAALTGTAFVALVVDADSDAKPWVLYLVLFLSLVSTVRVYRCIDILKLVTLAVDRPETTQ